MESEVSETGSIVKASSSPSLALTEEETLDQSHQQPSPDLSSPSTSATLSPPPFDSSTMPMQMEGEALIYPSPAPLHQENALDGHDDDDFYRPYPYFSDTTPSLFSPSPFSFEEQRPSLIGSGLANLGNTCFLNSILQCFTHTVPFLESLKSYNHLSPCLGSIEGGFCVICLLRDHIEQSLTSNGRVISPYGLADNIKKISSSFQRYQQEDAHEFLQCLLDKVDSCHLFLSKQVSSSSSQEESFVKKIFGGRLKSQLRCCNCGNRSDTFEPLIDLSLEIEDIDTLPDALKSFTKVEEIEGSETKLTCEICEQEVMKKKQFTLEEAPSVATFHLKRFKNNGVFVEKLDKYVEYPLELDLQPYTSSSENLNGKLKYVLYAVVVHNGFSHSSGHYFCYIRSAPDTWHKMDDATVVGVSEKHVLFQEAYILFYAREGTPWFSSFMEEQMQCMAGNTSTTSPTSVLDDMEIICPLQGESTVTRASTNVVAEPNIIEESMNMVAEPKVIEESANMGGQPEHTRGDTNMSTQPISFGESKFDTDRISSPPLVTCSDEAMKDRVHSSSPPLVTCSNEVVKDKIPSFPPPLATCSDEVLKDRTDYDVCPKTPPPRSPSPDIYADEPPGMSCDITPSVFKVRNSNENRRPSRSSSASKVLVETKRKEAMRLTKSMPTARGRAYREILLSAPQSERSSKRAKRKNDENCSPLKTHRRLIDFDVHRYKK